MAWPDNRTFTIDNVSATVWRDLKPEQVNLITSEANDILYAARERGAIQPFAGGDKFDVNTIISSGEASKEFDPSAVDPSTTAGTTGYQYLAPAEYKYFGRGKNITWPIALRNLTSNPRKLQDIFRTSYMANIMGATEELCNSSTSPGGFWSHTGVLPANGITNAKSMFADQTSDFAGVDVSSYDKWKPTLVSASQADGSALLTLDIQNYLNSAARGAEGGPSDIFTDDLAWRTIRARMISDGIMAVPNINADLGSINKLYYGGVTIRWSRFLAKGTAWDVTDTTTSETPFIAIDFGSLRFYVNPASSIPGDEFGLFTRANMPTLSDTTYKFHQRIMLVAQWALTKSRRTSGQMEGLTL